MEFEDLFGYVKPFKPEMRVREYESYKAVYCGLCRELGTAYGALFRFTLSYDFTFLALLGMGVAPTCQGFEQGRCFGNPLKKCNLARPSPALSLASASAMIMLYYKVLDNQADEGLKGRMEAAAALPFVGKARAKAAAQYPLIDQAVAQMMAEQATLEHGGCKSIDKACEPTAKALAAICCLLSEDSTQQRVLERLGYLLGRYVYLCDAMDDLDEDEKKGRYNPFLQVGMADRPALLEQAQGAAYLTIGELGRTLELLTLQRHGEILENIIFMGLKQAVTQIKGKKEQVAK